MNVICGGGVTPTVPVTASSWHNESFPAQGACLGNALDYISEGETNLTENEHGLFDFISNGKVIHKRRYS